MGVPVLWQDSLLRNVSHFLVSNVPSKFYLLLLVLFSNFQFKNLAVFLLLCLLPHHTTTLWEKGPKWKNRKNATDTHTHTAAAERALQFKMFCETLAGVGKMEMERHKGSGEMSIENWIHNLISLTSAQNVFLFVARRGEEEESCSQFGTDWSKFNSRRTHTAAAAAAAAVVFLFLNLQFWGVGGDRFGAFTPHTGCHHWSLYKPWVAAFSNSTGVWKIASIACSSRSRMWRLKCSPFVTVTDVLS